jgi:hypothetical protein
LWLRTNRKTPVDRRRADRTVRVAPLATTLSARVKETISAPRPIVDPNVWLTLNVHWTSLAPSRNASTRVLVHVVRTPGVASSITIPSAAVIQDSPATPSSNVHPSRVNNLKLIYCPPCRMLYFVFSNLFLEKPVLSDENVNPCVPSPCGPNSICRVQDKRAVCTCVPNYIGRPPNCRPECVSNSECPSNKACVNEKCVDPCVGSCGPNADCRVVSHRPMCTCQAGFTGDPFSGCSRVQSKLIAIASLTLTAGF